VLRTRTIQEWTNYGLLAVFMALQPLRALVSISDEQKASTLDLVQLTSLSSWKIVWGKWSALAGQTLLLAVSLLPYELLSYFMGGYDVVASSIQWLMLLGFSLGFTAFALALSSSGWFVRISMLGLPAFFAWVFMLEMVMKWDPFIVSSFPWYALSFHGLLATLFCLAVAAKRISAAVENSALWLRSIVLLQLLVSSAVGAWLVWKQDSNAGAWWFFALPGCGGCGTGHGCGGSSTPAGGLA
jgi:hypothetical protein